MPQNFPTRSVYLRQAQCLQVRTFPVYVPPNATGLAGATDGYRVVTVRLHDGRTIVGVLAPNDDTLLVPESEGGWDALAIADLSATPPELHPDFTVTDRKALECVGGIEMGNAWRWAAFGPPEKSGARERALTADEAHEQAAEYDRTVYYYPGELPATRWGVRSVVLTAEGVRVSYLPAAGGPEATATLWPKSAVLWAELLRQQFTIAEGFTLRSLITLMDLPPAVDLEVYHRTMPYHDTEGFRPWVDGAQQPAVRDHDVVEIVVSPYADYDEEEGDTFYFDMSGRGAPLLEDDPETGRGRGECESYSLGYTGPGPFLDLPIRYDPTLVLPVSHEEVMAYFRGPLFDWREAGEIGPRPEMPVRLRTRRTIRLGEFIGAVFDELGCSSHSPDLEVCEACLAESTTPGDSTAHAGAYLDLEN